MSYLRGLLTRCSTPLLLRELSQQSARKRTYVFRIVYALVAYFVGTLAISDVLAMRVESSPFGSLGEGSRVFSVVAITQFCVVYGFLPAYCCGLITAEKERNTLALLLLTKLGPTSSSSKRC